MKKPMLILGFLIALGISCNGQHLRAGTKAVSGGGVSSGVQAASKHADALQAGSSRKHNNQVKLNKKQRRQARLAKKQRRQERRNQRAAQKEAARLKAAQSTNYEDFQKAHEVNNLQAAANENNRNSLALNLKSQNLRNSDAAIKENHNSGNAQGTKFGHTNFVNADQFSNAEVLNEADAFAEDGISAAEGSEDHLDAGQLNQHANNDFINSKNQNQKNLISQNGAFQDDFFGSQNQLAVPAFGGLPGFGRR